MAPEKKPRTIGEWFEYARICFHKPDGLEAVKALEKVIDMDPGYIHPDGDNPYFYLGKINEVEGRLQEAVMLYTRALTVDFEDEESLIGRGSCQSVLGKHAEAVEDFKKALRIPDKKRKCPKKHLFYAIADNYRELRDWGQAIFWAQQAVNVDPGDESHRQLLEKLIAKISE